jgi:uncharacterized membrane protein
MRWIQMIFSFIMKQVNHNGEKRHPIEELKEFAKENAIKLFVGMVLIVTLGTMLTAGVYMAAVSVTAQADLGLRPRMSAMTWAGVIMALVPVLLLTFAWFKSSGQTHDSKPSKRSRRKNESAQPTSLESAVALLVTDFVKEREMKREMRYEREARLARAEMMNANANMYRTGNEDLEQ